MPYSSDVEEELAKLREEEEEEQRRADELEQMAQQQRLAQEHSKAAQAKQAAQQVLKTEAGAAITAQGKRLFAGLAGRGAVAALAYSFPVWGPILGIILLIFFVITFFVSMCNAPGASVLSSSIKILSFGQTDICGAFTVNPNPMAQVPPVQTQSNPGDPDDLVVLTGIPTRGPVNNRVRACMEPFVRSFFARAQASGLDIVLTSAYRPGAITIRDDGSRVPSAHGRGEAFDVALVNLPARPWGKAANPAQPMSPFNITRHKDLETLQRIGQSVGFRFPQGDVVDEYNFPNVQSSAPHFHIEFNSGYCGVYQG